MISTYSVCVGKNSVSRFLDQNQQQSKIKGMDNYMTENKIPELLGNLMKNLAVSKPEDPIEFMIELLTKSDKRR